MGEKNNATTFFVFFFFFPFSLLSSLIVKLIVSGWPENSKVKKPLS